MKRFIHRISKWFLETKSKASAKLPTYDDDKQKHYIVVKAVLLFVITGISIAWPLLALKLIGVLLFGAFLWELPELFKSKWSQPARKEAQQDWLMAFFAVFLVALQLIFRVTGVDAVESVGSSGGLSVTAIIGVTLASIAFIIIAYKFIKEFNK
ncbi:MAG: hypothetical protein ACOH2D_11540 [Gelidibacter sp.]